MSGREVEKYIMHSSKNFRIYYLDIVYGLGTFKNGDKWFEKAILKCISNVTHHVSLPEGIKHDHVDQIMPARFGKNWKRTNTLLLQKF